MLHGREKVGDGTAHKVITADGAAAASMLTKKNKRLTFPFGPAETGHRRDIRETRHEHYIREIPLAGGGLGCALWDGGLVLARWVYENGRTVFHRRSVMELGCGVGLAGIMAAHWADSVVLTDYIDETVRNALYNVTLNSHDDDEDEDEDEDDDESTDANDTPYPYQWNIKQRVTARLLDWDAFAAEERHAHVQQQQPQDAPCCVSAADHLGHLLPASVQPWHRCRTCWPSDESAGVCSVCASRCHMGHDVDLAPLPAEKFQCDCSKVHTKSTATTESAGVCLAVPPQPPLQPVDIIIGSELTYNLLSCASLATVVDTLLKPKGVFYEVLSDDRDGVSVFIEEMEKRGFSTVKRPAPARFVGNFGTRKWSKQNEESYSFYTWRRLDQQRGVEGEVADAPAELPDMS